MEKNCIYCNNPLDLKLHGLTKYCSTRCRNKDYYIKKKNESENEKKIESPGGEEFPECPIGSYDQQNYIYGHRYGHTTSLGPETDSGFKENKDNSTFPEIYKIILEEKGKNYELLARINQLELQNETLKKENNDLVSENALLELDIENLEDTDEESGQIFGMPKAMVENVVVQLLTPHAAKIVAGLTGEKTKDSKL